MKRVRLAAMLAASILASSAHAAAVSGAPESPGTALSRHIRVLATSPQDFNALIGAGKAALELGDVQAAAGFFGRAEEAYPRSPAPKAGLGAAMAHMGDADGAIFYFDQAIRLGASPLAISLDRGLARDLNGDLGAAQSDYRTAIDALNSDEARRRLALSLAIGRDKDGALAAIQPLLNRRDPGAQRTRAFVLALVGDQAGAAQAIESVMPGASARFAPFFTFLPNLSNPEKAAAVHLGIFPENPEQRVAMAQSQRPAPSVPLGTRANQPTLSLGGPAAGKGTRTPPRPVETPPVKIARSEPPQVSPSAAFSLPSQRSSASPSFSQPSTIGATSTASNQAQSEPEPVVEQAESAPEAVESEIQQGNLSGIDKLLSTIAEVPPPPLPKMELKKVDTASSKKAAADKKAADKMAAEEKKKREAKLTAEKKEREEAAKLGVKGTYWVQLAGGSNQDRLSHEYRQLASKAGSLLKSRSGYITEGKSYYRLLVGPFDSKSESQNFVNKLAKEGVDGFSWNRTPAQIKIERISSR